jgi:glycosyltransferase involved in cell wall biosynthesis
LISAELHIPHVAAIVGSDFSRGSRNAIERAKLQEVCSRAACVVCKSQEQSKGLQIIVPELQARVIPTPNNYPVSRQRSAGSDGSIEVFADCGLSYHKGTAVLLDSLLALRSEGLDIKLTLCGSISDIEESYWQRTLVDMKCVAKSSFLYLGYIERPAIHSYLERSHIYCSATLGEGSSAARIAALCSGIPMVTTSCGEFANEVGHMSHIRVVQPGDAAGFRAQLRDLCRMAMQHGIAIDWDGVARCRDEFSPERTWRAWTEMLASIAARDQGLSSISASEIP